jgi:hypothetical protein
MFPTATSVASTCDDVAPRTTNRPFWLLDSALRQILAQELLGDDETLFGTLRVIEPTP